MAAAFIGLDPMTKRFSTLFVFSSLVLLPCQRIRGDEPAKPSVPDVPAAAVAPTDPPLSEARTAMDAGDWKKARKVLKKYVGTHDKSSEGWTLLARTYLAAGSTGKALSRFDKALKYDPHYAPAFLGRGEVYEKRGRWDEALNDFQAAALADPTLSEAQQAVARLGAKSSPAASK